MGGEGHMMSHRTLRPDTGGAAFCKRYTTHKTRSVGISKSWDRAQATATQRNKTAWHIIIVSE